MTIQAFSGITDKAPLSPAYFNAKFAEVYSVLNSLDTQTVTNYNVRTYGATGNGTTDDTAAIRTAIAAANQGAVYFPAGTYRITSTITPQTGTKFITDAGYLSATILKAHTGAGFGINVAGVEFRHLAFSADTATNPSYGTQGPMLQFTADAADARILNVNSSYIDSVVSIGADCASRLQIVGGYWLPYNTTAGSEGTVYQTGIDTGARFRSIFGLVTDGQISQKGAIDSEMQGVCCRRVVTDANTGLLGVQGGIWGSLNQPVTVDGSDTRIMGIRVSGNITLASTMAGASVFVGNTQTFGTFTDNSPVNSCIVMHHPLSASYDLVDRHKLFTASGTGGVIRTYRRVSPGDSMYTWSPEAGVSDIRFGTTLTSNRTAALEYTNAVDGHGVWISRPAAGNFEVRVNSGTTVPTSIMSLAQNTWASAAWNGSSYEIVAAGSLTRPPSSISTKVGAFVVQGSASSFTLVLWNEVQPGDQIAVAIFPDATASSLSSGLVLHSHCTVAGQVEMRLSNVSTLVQNQSSKTYYLTRTSPF